MAKTVSVEKRNGHQENCRNSIHHPRHCTRKGSISPRTFYNPDIHNTPGWIVADKS